MLKLHHGRTTHDVCEHVMPFGSYYVVFIALFYSVPWTSRVRGATLRNYKSFVWLSTSTLLHVIFVFTSLTFITYTSVISPLRFHSRVGFLRINSLKTPITLCNALASFRGAHIPCPSSQALYYLGSPSFLSTSNRKKGRGIAIKLLVAYNIASC